MFSHWLKLIMWLATLKQNALFLSRVITELWNLFMRLAYGVGSNCLVNCATTTDKYKLSFNPRLQITNLIKLVTFATWQSGVVRPANDERRHFARSSWRRVIRTRRNLKNERKDSSELLLARNGSRHHDALENLSEVSAMPDEGSNKTSTSVTPTAVYSTKSKNSCWSLRIFGCFWERKEIYFVYHRCFHKICRTGGHRQ